MSTTRIPPRIPPLPTETKAHILSYCDQQTLGRAAGASLELLELAGPLLYQDITVKGYNQCLRLLGQDRVSGMDGATDMEHQTDKVLREQREVGPREPMEEVDRCLSLSQLRTFTFMGIVEDRQLDKLLPSRDRMPRETAIFYGLGGPNGTGCRLEVDTLRVHICAPLKTFKRGRASRDAQVLLRRFNPKHVYIGSHSNPHADSWRTSGIWVKQLGWTRIESITMGDIAVEGLLPTSNWTHEPPFDIPKRSLKVTFDLGGIDPGKFDETAHGILWELVKGAEYNGSKGEELVYKIVLEVNSTKDKNNIEEWIRINSGELSREVIEGTLELVSAEVVTKK